MSLSMGASNNIQDGDDSLKSHGLTSVADNETLIRGSVEFSQEITSHSIKSLQHVESHQVASSSRTIRLKDESTRALARAVAIPGGRSVVIRRRPYRSQRMRAINDNEVIEENRKRTKMSALSKRKKSTP
ncbi:hypothetical protein H5410_012920 [Solanum commersonii]|uniref:Uncharacterized protein n=1 Tax=Solanum commersonii TaxID=4109 RepID=A0A9J6AT11_SOLCO|nr:hypothetical protein H5410_012920 [Solanum commersonii]